MLRRIAMFSGVCSNVLFLSLGVMVLAGVVPQTILGRAMIVLYCLALAGGILTFIVWLRLKVSHDSTQPAARNLLLLALPTLIIGVLFVGSMAAFVLTCGPLDSAELRLRADLSQLGLALLLYEVDYGGMPANLQILVDGGYVKDTDVLAFRWTGERRAGGISLDLKDVDRTSAFCYRKPPTGGAVASVPMAWARQAKARGGKTTVLMADGRLADMKASDLPTVEEQ